MVHVNSEKAFKEHYLRAIQSDNCLAKRSGKTRKLTARHLVDLYALDPRVTLFKVLRYFWKHDPAGQPLLAFLTAYARDNIVRMSTPFILSVQQGERVTREDLELFLDKLEPGRFRAATLRSVAQNLNATWTKSGHLNGRVRKIRSQANATPGATSYALLLGYLRGIRGISLFESEYARLLDCSNHRAIELAEEASRRGWIILKRVGAVIEVRFPNLLTAQEVEWLREQG
jgi:hypothetical protein